MSVPSGKCWVLVPTPLAPSPALTPGSCFISEQLKAPPYTPNLQRLIEFQGQGVWKLIDAVQVVSLRGGAEQDGKAESGPGEASSRWSANVSTELSLSASAQSQQLITEWILYPCPF